MSAPVRKQSEDGPQWDKRTMLSSPLNDVTLFFFLLLLLTFGSLRSTLALPLQIEGKFVLLFSVDRI